MDGSQLGEQLQFNLDQLKEQSISFITIKIDLKNINNNENNLNNNLNHNLNHNLNNNNNNNNNLNNENNENNNLINNNQFNYQLLKEKFKGSFHIFNSDFSYAFDLKNDFEKFFDNSFFILRIWLEKNCWKIQPMINFLVDQLNESFIVNPIFLRPSFITIQNIRCSYLPPMVFLLFLFLFLFLFNYFFIFF